MTEDEVCQDPVKLLGQERKPRDDACHDTEQSVATSGAKHLHGRVEGCDDGLRIRGLRSEERRDA